MFWVWRVDLVSLPLFVAGAIAVIFGVRTLWRQRLPVLFLLFAWPFPYTMVLLRWLDTFTNVTLVGVRSEPRSGKWLPAAAQSTTPRS